MGAASKSAIITSKSAKLDLSGLLGKVIWGNLLIFANLNNQKNKRK
jgi:hypothetical protein